MSTKTPGGGGASEKFMKQQAEKQGHGAPNAPGRTDPGVPADAKVAADSYTSTVGIDNSATNVPGEKGDVSQKVGEKADGISGGTSMKQ